MSMIRDFMQHIEDRGWTGMSTTVCSGCLIDPVLRDTIKQYGDNESCTYCRQTPRQPNASAPFDILTDLVVDGLRYEYEDPIESVLVEHGEYMWPTLETEDLLINLDVADDYAILSDLGRSISTDIWCERDPYGDPESAVIQSVWKTLVNIVTQEATSMTAVEPLSSTDRDQDDPVRHATTLINRQISTANLFTIFPAETRWWRARTAPSGKTFHSAADLGPPPKAKALNNRMSKKGIPMFYGASTRQGARQEILDQADSGSNMSFGHFVACQELEFVDLRTTLIKPSLFDRTNRHKRQAIEFLKGFTQDIRKPGLPSATEIIPYAATQTITDSLRTDLKTSTNKAPDGVLWNSSKDPSVTCCVIFVDETQVSDAGNETTETVLSLSPADTYHDSGTV